MRSIQRGVQLRMGSVPPSLCFALSPAGCPFGDGLRTARVEQSGAVAARNRPQLSRCRLSLNSATRWPKDGGKRIAQVST
jgi:hypothetical protein